MAKDLDLSYDDTMEGDESKAPAKAGLPIRPLTRMLLRRWPIILGCFGVSTVAAIVAASGDPPLYGGSFRLLVEPVTSEGRISEPTALTRTAGGIPNQDLFTLDYPSQLEILRSQRLLQPVYENVQRKYPAFSYGELIQGLTVERSGRPGRDNQTRILDIAYQGYDTELIQTVLDEISAKYLSYSLADRKTRISEGVRFIEDQLPGLQKRVDDLQSGIQDIQQTYNLVNPIDQGDVVYGRLNTVGELQIQTQQDLQEQRALYATLQRQLQLSPDEAIAVSALSQDPRYQQVLTGINEVEAQLATESTRWGDAAPPIQRLQAQRNSLYNLLSQRTVDILGSATAPSQGSQALTFQDSVRQGLVQQLVDTANQIQVLEVRSEALAQNRALIDQQVEQFPGIAREYGELQRQLDIATRTLDQLLSQRETLRVAAAQNQVPWEVIADPTIPRDATGAPIAAGEASQKKLMAGAAFGLALGMGIAFLIERRQDRFYDAEDVKDLIPAPRLGIIPICTETDPATQWLAIAHADGQIEELSKDAFDFQDAFDTFHANLRFLNQNSPVRSVVICSANEGDGKTTTALHLAQTAAASGQRVLLVDTNFRSAKIHRNLGLRNTKGLADILRHKITADEAIQSFSGIDNLQILSPGSITPGATRLLASPHMKSLMQKFEATYDLVIYDSPNLSDAVDASFIGNYADGILLVVAVNQSSRSKVAESVRKLKDYGIPLLGTVANRANQKTQHPETLPTWDDEDDDDEASEERLLAPAEEEPVYQSRSLERSALVRDGD